MADYIDYERFGKDIAAEEDGTFTDYGYVLKESSPLPIHYDGLNVPDEYRVTAEAENYLKNAEMMLEDDFGMIDGIINNGPKEGSIRDAGEKTKASPPGRSEKASIRDALEKICKSCAQKEACSEIGKFTRSGSEPAL